jgi:hypothetical protein
VAVFWSTIIMLLMPIYKSLYVLSCVNIYPNSVRTRGLPHSTPNWLARFLDGLAWRGCLCDSSKRENEVDHGVVLLSANLGWDQNLQSATENNQISPNTLHPYMCTSQEVGKGNITFCTSFESEITGVRTGSRWTESASSSTRTINCHCLDLRGGSASTSDIVSIKYP